MTTTATAGRWILHVDLDQFVAAVEIRRHPQLRGRPVVVGGSGDPAQARMVVATASYEARAAGVRSGMPLRAAARRCPEAVFLPTDPPAYEAASVEVMETLRRFPVVVEVSGWDEAFLGAETGDPEGLAAELRAAVLAATGLSCSIGIGDNKVRAKLATGFAKPAGIFRLTAANWDEVMAHRPVRELWGIGSRMSRNLAGLGIATVAELAAADESVLTDRFGPRLGRWYHGLGRGLGDSHVTDLPREPVSRSRETTCPVDLTDRTEIEERLTGLATGLTRDIAAEGRSVLRVSVKVRYSSFFTATKSRKLPEPTGDPGTVAQAALTVLARFDLDRPVRLLGVRAEFAPDG